MMQEIPAHWILRAENSRFFFREVHEWLARWLAPPTSSH